MDLHSNDSLVLRCHFLTFNTEDIAQVRHIYIVAASLNAILILPTIFLNILLIISLYRSPQLNKPCTNLLYSLAVSDVLVGMVIEPAYLVKKMAELQHSFEGYCIAGMMTYIVGWNLGGISFFNLTAIAVDRYLVVHSGAKYPTVVTNRKVTCAVLSIWILNTIFCLTQFAISRSTHFKAGAAIMMIGLMTASFCYIRVFITLRRQKKITQTLVEHSNRLTAINCYRYKRSISTMLYIFVIFMLCYLPFMSVAVSAGILGDSPAIWGTEAVTSVITYANSLINPIILFWRMKEIGKSASSTLSSRFTSSKSSLEMNKINAVDNVNQTQEKIEKKKNC